MEQGNFIRTLQNPDGTFCVDLYPATYIHDVMLATRHSKRIYCKNKEIAEYLTGVIKVCKCALRYLDEVQVECKAV